MGGWRGVRTPVLAVWRHDRGWWLISVPVVPGLVSISPTFHGAVRHAVIGAWLLWRAS